MMKNLNNLREIIDSNLRELDMSPESKERLKLRVKEKNRNLRKFTIPKLAAMPVIAAVVVLIIFLNSFLGTGALRVSAMNLMENISPKNIAPVKLSEDFIKSTADFSVDLLKQTAAEGKNTLISPTSVYLALGMTANGATGNTLREFETVLGRYGINIDELNKYYYSLSKELLSTNHEKLNIANSIWYRNDESFKVSRDFLQTNSDYYGASAYQADFDSDKTVEDINNWVKHNTGGLIDRIIERIDPLTVMFLINTLYFEGEWETVYEKHKVSKNNFKLEDGTLVPVEFMHSMESIYLKDDRAQGFLKPYKGGKYSFMALLPNEDISLESYVASLTGEYLLRLINSKANEDVSLSLPKFKTEFEKELKEPLTKLGLKECFDSSADFSRMVDFKGEDLYISSILHKTFLKVDEAGTKAGAATKVEVQKTGMPMKSKRIVLNRPFLYAIIDNTTNLPIFLGVMKNPLN